MSRFTSPRVVVYVAEALEPRRLLAASISLAGDGTMIVHGAEGVGNKITVSRTIVGSLQFIDAVIEVQTNPKTQITGGYNVNQVARVRIDGGAGTDTADVYVNVQKPVTTTDPTNGEGDLLRFQGSTGNDTIAVGINSQFRVTSGATDVVVTEYFERVQVLAYEGNDTIRLFGDFFTPTEVYGMTGNDTVNLDHVHNHFALAFGEFTTYPITIDGGGAGGVDTLNVNDQVATNSTYDLPNFTGLPLLQTFDNGNGIAGAELRFINLTAVNVNAGELNDAFTAAVTLPGMNVTYNGNGGDDSFAVGDGFNSLNAPLTVNGGAGIDSLAMDNSSFNLDCDYEITASTVKYGSVLPLQTAVVYSGVESNSLLGTPNADTFKLFPVDGPFTINGGAGIDSIAYVGSVIGYAPDRYIFTAASMQHLRRLQPTGGVFGVVNTIAYPNVEGYTLTCSGDTSSIDVRSTSATTPITIYGGLGNDFLTVGETTNKTANILSRVTFDGQDGSDVVTINNQSDAAGAVVHLDSAGVGHYPNDTLFGPGGSFVFTSVSTMTVNLGSGADSVFAQPTPATAVTINGGGPLPAATPGAAPGGAPGAPVPGDALTLGFATAANPQFTPGAAGAGTYTFSGSATLAYSGFESRVVDSVAPAALAGGYDYDAPAPAVTVAFSEDVSALLAGRFLTLHNVTTGALIAPADLAATFDAATNTARFTYAGGLPLPDGDYQATLARGLTDAATNATTKDFAFTLFSFAGDANRDRSVNFNDLVALARNYNVTGGRSWADGDFTGDGNVDFEDLVVLAQHYNTSLGAPPATGAPAVTSFDAAMAAAFAEAAPATVTPPIKAKPVLPVKVAPRVPARKPLKGVNFAEPAPVKFATTRIRAKRSDPVW